MFPSFKCIPLFVLLCWLNLGPYAQAASSSLPEAEQIALESSGELLPPSDLSKKVENDLAAIRKLYPDVSCILHPGKWAPGVLLVTGIANETLDAIDGSKYGPIEAKSLSGDTLIITFSQPYNPIKLAELLKEEFDVEKAEPNNHVGTNMDIALTSDENGVNTYVFYIGSGDCSNGCTEKRYITFTVDSEGFPLLTADTGTGSPCGP